VRACAYGLRLGNSDAGTDPAGSTTHQAYAALAQGFGPGFNGPLELAGHAGSPADVTAFNHLLATAAHTPGALSVTPAATSPNGNAAAASIMILVFGSFLLGGQRVLQEFGFGLGFAVLVDALVIRGLLVPALMHLIGPANWALPGWLDRILPRVAVEAGEQAPAAGPEDGMDRVGAR